jgi:hypothetical protein
MASLVVRLLLHKHLNSIITAASFNNSIYQTLKLWPQQGGLRATLNSNTDSVLFLSFITADYSASHHHSAERSSLYMKIRV